MRRFVLGALVSAAAAGGCSQARPTDDVQTTVQVYESNTLCRGARVPSGWIIIDYVRDPRRCDAGAGRSYNVAYIAQYAILPVGETLQVCAGQPIPAGWTRTGDASGPIRCPREPNDPGQEPTSLFIRRES